jgi:transcriptional accessory protein Tex/SPT6
MHQKKIGAGTTSQSSGILRTHYSVIENVVLAQQSWAVFKDFAGHLQDEDASAGLVRCGYLIAAPHGPKLEPLAQSLAAQQAQGIEVHRLSAQEASERLPICRFDDAALIGFEPEAGFADAPAVLDGVRDLLSERWAEDAALVRTLREWLWSEGLLQSRLVEGKDGQHPDAAKFRAYFDYAEPMRTVPSHRALAVDRKSVV